MADYGSGIEVDKIIALRCLNGFLSEYSMQNAKEAVISSGDGSFSISLEKDASWILILVNSQASGTDKFVGYVALNDGAGENLLQIPVANVSGNSLDLGNLDQSVSDTEIALADNTAVTATTFAMDVDDLIALARNDNYFKYVKNFYFNYANNVYYTIRPCFRWSGDYFTMTATPVAPAFIYKKYELVCFTNSTEYTLDNYCGTNGADKIIMGLHPPLGSEVPSDKGITYTYDFPLSTTAAVTYTLVSGTSYHEILNQEISIHEGSFTGLSYNIGSFSNTIPAEIWTWVITNTVTPSVSIKGLFDLEVGSPVTGTNMVKGFAPMFKVNLDNDTNRHIDSVDIIWFALNSAGDGYDVITDTSVLKYIINTANFGFGHYSGGTRGDNLYFDPATQTHFVPSQTWYYNKPSAGLENAESIGWSYKSGGVEFFFEMRSD